MGDSLRPVVGGGMGPGGFVSLGGSHLPSWGSHLPDRSDAGASDGRHYRARPLRLGRER
jgi:hypothetical protein